MERWIGLFSSEPVKPHAGNLLDTLCARLEGLMNKVNVISSSRHAPAHYDQEGGECSK
ncbi:hypothetical protein QCA50_017820 [Cerrena zonata]|uniref:Uncharacterized protein n=1 Tax=Cerrena zonata TaxID=2478898 RepID=A0AAW0FPM4_9APHY